MKFFCFFLFTKRRFFLPLGYALQGFDFTYTDIRSALKD